ncbi:MAG: penicillin acylase family protein [Pirellulales bacterium]
MRKRFLKIAAAAVAVLVVLLAGAGYWARSQLAGSLPQLDGEVIATGISQPVAVERDALGIPTIRAGNRLDLAFATGFVHAQDRFFQMDLLRRNSAGELAELVGPAVIRADRKVRVHRFRKAARRLLASGNEEDRKLLEAYAKGVNAGLSSLAKKPFEYLLLGAEPAPWKPEDSALVMFSMYLDLQGNDFRDEAALGLLHDTMSPAMFDFLAPKGTEWDAPIVGEAFQVPPIPGPEAFDTRKSAQVARHLLAPTGSLPLLDHFQPGSNNWAVSGKKTADGRALVADDMHLGIRVPHIWYRASFVWPSETAEKADDRGKEEQRVTGVSLPGTPAIIVGSNGHVAWGFTNSEGDWVDVVIVETDPDDEDSYLTPDGPRRFERTKEVVKVKDGPDEIVEISSTIWGPIMAHDRRNRPLAIRWVAHDPDGVNMGLLRMESARTLEDALRLANLSGSPAQNFVVADDRGRIGWTILGRIPRRVGFDGRLPVSWADGTRRWDGYLEPEEYPRIVEPESGRIWTANARVASGRFLELIGDGGYDLGARQQQIRDDLLATENATEADMLRIQLDDRAVFLERWQRLLLETLTSDAVAADPRRGKLRRYVENWGGRASVDSVGFRAVRAFRHRLFAQLCDVLGNPCKQLDKDFSLGRYERVEGAVWRLVSEKPAHLIDPRFKDWNALVLAAADGVIAETAQDGARMADYTWGRQNTTKIQHPLSLAVPMLSRWLDMAPEPLPGDWDNMPHIQAPERGASQRMAVSPGHESEGYMHMPCGQSGHPLSGHYRDSHDAWAEGKATPFLPGETVHTLVLKPAAAGGG